VYDKNPKDFLKLAASISNSCNSTKFVQLVDKIRGRKKYSDEKFYRFFEHFIYAVVYIVCKLVFHRLVQRTR
jgi:hypothetical protein